MDIEEAKKKIEELQAALDKASKGSDNDVSKDLERLAAENKELIAARDKAKQKAREAEEAKLLENEEFKTLAEQRQAALDALESEKAKMEENLTVYQQRDEARLAKLMESVPEDKRPLIKDSFSLPDRLELAESFAQTNQSPPKPRLPGEGGKDQPLTSVQRIAAGLKKGL